MVLIKSLTDLDVLGRPLQEGDTLQFTINGKVLSYRVYEKYCEGDCSNDAIFRELGYMTEDSKREFATLHYGHQARPGGWPETQCNDKNAMTRLVKEIFRRISLGKPEWKEGMIVTVRRQCSECYPGKHYVLKKNVANELKADNGNGGGCTCCSDNWVLIPTEVNKMELNEIKKANLTEAAKQVTAEKMNAEIAFAKQKFVEAKNRVDELDRQIKQAEEAKKPYLEILAKFK